MQYIRRSAVSTGNRWLSVLKSQNGLRSFLEYNSAKCFSDVGLAGFSSSARKGVIGAEG
ncbi:hypothetical protein SLEP1_g9377 [Rubroshorea leprosula]|uniref:Ribosomal protein L32 n=1 Tax=Rubroshorea leprosula TaxID=152421 RepID=A0AAV5I982_9ROSI|nr:hypothetical protein SLEP1_g9377 [Rubroshorea leprosula]